MKELVLMLWSIVESFVRGKIVDRSIDSLQPKGEDAFGGNARLDIELPTGYSREQEELSQRDKIVSYCRSQLGKGYQLGIEIEPGQEKDAANLDCSEMVEAAYRLADLKIPDGAVYQFNECRPCERPRAGDLGFLWSDPRKMIGHVMVSTGVGTVIHAVSGRGVVEDPVSQWDSHRRWRGWRRHPDFIQEHGES